MTLRSKYFWDHQYAWAMYLLTVGHNPEVARSFKSSMNLSKRILEQLVRGKAKLL